MLAGGGSVDRGVVIGSRLLAAQVGWFCRSHFSTRLSSSSLILRSSYQPAAAPGSLRAWDAAVGGPPTPASADRPGQGGRGYLKGVGGNWVPWYWETACLSVRWASSSS
jgi:hypothetical protein